MQIKKTPHIIKRLAEVAPSLKEYVETLETCPFEELIPKIQEFGTLKWDRPRGDLCAWIPVLNRFDLIIEELVVKYGLNNEHPKPVEISKEDEYVLVNILHFSSFLLEKCSNRGIYASIKHLACLLNAISPAIVAAALRVSVQLAHRFAQSRAGKGNVTAIEPEKIFKLATLLPTSHWETPDKRDIAYIDYIAENGQHDWGNDEWLGFSIQYYVRSGNKVKEIVGTSSEATSATVSTFTSGAGFQPNTPTRSFHRQNNDSLSSIGAGSSGTPSTGFNPANLGGSSDQSSEGLATLNISSDEVKNLSLVQLLEKLYSVLPQESWFLATCKARVAKACTNPASKESIELRRQLCKIQFLALAFACCTFSESTVDSRIISKAPNLIRQIGSLIAPENSSIVGAESSVLALETLEFVCHQPARRSDVLAALSANVSHGVLMTVVRNIIRDLQNDSDDHTFNEEHACRVFRLILQLAFTQSLGAILVTTGLVQLLLEVIQINTPYVRTLASAMELLDQVIIDISSTFSTFSQSGGIGILINVIKREIEYDLSPDRPEEPIPDYCTVDYSLSFHRSQWIRSLFVVVSNILVHTRTTENIHNLVDSPLLQASKLVISNPSIFGSRVVSLNLQILSSMLENEPSSFGIMHEAKLVDTVLNQVPVLLAKSFSYFAPIAKLIGALSHNEHGIKLVQDRNMIAKFIESLSNSITKNETLPTLGAVFEGLTSDHPDLRIQVVSESKVLLRDLPKLLEPVSDPASFYTESEPSNIANSGNNSPSQDGNTNSMEDSNVDIDIDIDSGNQMTQQAASNSSPTVTADESPEIVVIVGYVVAFFDGLLKNHLTRVQFIKKKGVADLLSIFEIPNLPYDFAFSSVGYTLGRILRALFTLDIDSDLIQHEIIERIEKKLSEVEEKIRSVSEESQVVRDDIHLDDIQRSLATLNGLLQAFFQMVFYDYGTGYRVMFVLDKIVEKWYGNLITRLAEVQRWCIWQESRSLDGLSNLFIEATRPLSVDISRTETDDYKKIKEAEAKLEDSVSKFFVHVKAFRFIANANSIMCSKIFSELAAICTSERAISTRKKEGLQMAELIGKEMVLHLDCVPFIRRGFANDDMYQQAKLHTLISTLAVLQKVMFKPWESTLAAYLGVFVIFKQQSGLQTLLRILEALWDVPELSGSTDSDTDVASTGSLLLFAQKVILMFLGYTISHRSLLENERLVSPISARGHHSDDDVVLNPKQFFVECRIIVLHSLQPLWESDNLESKDFQISQLLLDIMTKLFSYTGEDGCDKGPRDQLPKDLNWRQISPLDYEVEALVAAGFTDHNARQALIATGHNALEAFEYLIQHGETAEVPLKYFEYQSTDNVGNSCPISSDGTRLVLLSDLNELRESVKSKLIDRTLNLIQSRPKNVFAAAQLIIKAHSSVGGPKSDRERDALAVTHKDIVTTILQALSSCDTDNEEHNQQIAAVSHFLGLILQDGPFFASCFEDLVESIDLFLSLLTFERAHEQEWYPNILLIIERIITNVSVPETAEPKFDTSNLSSAFDIFKSVLPKISKETEEKIFNTLAKPLPFKSDTAALATARLYVHFSKDPDRAALLKGNPLENLLRSVLQFGDSPNLEKLETAILIVLRQTVETKASIRKTMIKEIKAWFAPQRLADAIVFIRAHSHLVCRSADIFVEVASELLTLQDPSLNSSHLCLKEYLAKRRKRTLQIPKRISSEEATDDEHSEEIEDKKGEEEGEKVSQEKTSNEDDDSASKTGKAPKEDVTMIGNEAPGQASKIPILSESSGVINLVLSELFKLKAENIYTLPTKTEEALQEYISKNKTEPAFKYSEHKPFIYCYFLLKILIELLGSYNQCKLEFFNFSTKAQLSAPMFTTGPQSSKPKPYMLLHFIHEYLAIGVVNAPQSSTPVKEWTAISGLASSVILSLLTSTGEADYGSTNDDIQNDTTIVFVRKFALDIIAKTLKDIHTTYSSLDWKYSLLSSLSELCHRLLSNRPGFSSAGPSNDIADGAAIAKIMYDKKFASLFSVNIGMVDLNYPHVKKVVKLDLKFLHKLSRLALDISDQLATDGGQDDNIDEEEYDSELDIREDTPDLFRNSTLGMYEVGDPMYDDDEELEEDEVVQAQVSDEMDYDDVNDEALSDVDDDASDANESIDYDEDDDDEEEESDDSDVDSDVEDDGMGVEIIVESQEDDDDDDQDMDIEVDEDSDEEGEWESYDEDEEGEIVDGFHNELDDAAVNILEELSGRPSHGRSVAPFSEEDGDDVIYSTRQPIMEDGHRDYSSDDDGEDDEEDEEESIDIDYEDDPDNYFEFSNAFSRLVPGGIRIDGHRHGQSRGDTVSNPLLSQPSSTPRLAIPRSIHSDGVADLSAQLRNASSQGGPSQDILSAILGQFIGVFGGQDRGIDISQIGISQHGSTMEAILPMDATGFHRTDRFADSIYNIPHANPVPSFGRWREASRMFDVFEHADIAGRVLMAIFNNIVPYAIEEEKKAKEIEKEIRAIHDENRKKKDEIERKKKEKEEEERKKREEAEAAAAAAAAAEENARREEEEALAAARANDSTSMDQDEEAPAGNTSSESNEPRVFVSISGRDVDITGLGIDPTFLEALPADIREEAFTQHIRELRASGGGSDGATREIEPEFLEALPENIRDELMAQEALDRRTQLLESVSGGDGSGEMDLASFLATLDPSLRQTVLLEQGEDALSSLPAEIAQEAQELRSRTIASFSQGSGSGSRGNGRSRNATRRLRQNLDSVFRYDDESDDEDERVADEHEHLLESSERRLTKKVLSAAALHLVDRSGIAALVRLLYLPQNINQREQLHELLFNLCSNKQSRTDILNIIIHVLLDGSADSHALERGFLQISHRAVNSGKENKDNQGGKLNSTPKTPNITPAKNSSNSVGYLSLNEDISPVIVTQQVLEALEYLVRYSGSVKYFFLCEHEFPIGFKRHGKVKLKGKEKERDNKDIKFPINMLIHLLDRPVVHENNLTLELLSSLIQEVTRSLPIVLKDSSKEDKDKDKDKDSKVGEGKNDEEKSEKEKPSEGEDSAISTKRTHKLIDAPFIPEKNLKRISSILTAKECSSRTFQQTLAVMHNLCAISGVRDLFGKELLEQAMSVGPSLIGDLKELLGRVEMVEKGSDLQGDALAKFSSGSSDQTKLLRVLTAIDYLFNPSRDQKEKDNTDKDTSKDDATEYLKSLYEKMTFGPLWGALSDCLRLIQDRQDMIHVATALLPLIEALMVICKNSRVKDVELRDHNRYEAKKYDIATEPLESLFFSFTDEHRKILNQMVRNNPKLMSGSFSILIKNPKALEFDNKRRYFYRRIYNNNQNPTGAISIQVRRDQVFLDSYKALYFKSASEIKNSRFNIRFQGEEGVDAGGVTREWYQVLSRQIFNPDYALFSPVASDSTTFHPNRTSWVNPEHLSFFKFIGRIIGKAIFDFKLLDCHFSRAVYKKILGKPVSIKDMETLDLDYYKSLVWMMENDITDIITETFSIEAEDYGEQKIIDLKPGGRDIPVTEENKQEYVHLVVDYRLIKSVQEQLDHFLEGK